MEQLCVLCDKLFEVDDSFKVIRPMMRGRMLVLDKDGVCHELLSEKKTGQRHRAIQKKETAYIVRQVEQMAEAPMTIAPPTIPEPAPKKHQLLGTARSELNNGGFKAKSFCMIDGVDGQEYLLRGDGIVPDVNGLCTIQAGERVIFTPNQRFRKNIATELIPLRRANDPTFEPDFQDWWNLTVEVHDLDKGFAIGNLVGADVEVFVPSRTVFRQSTNGHAFRDVKVGDTLAVRIKPSDEVSNKFETIVAIYEDMPPEVPEENPKAKLGDISLAMRSNHDS